MNDPIDLPLGFEVGRHRRGWLDPDDPNDAITIDWLHKLRAAGQAVEIKVLTNPAHKWLWRRRNIGVMYMGCTYVNARPADAAWLLKSGDLGVVWGGPEVIRVWIDYGRWEAAHSARARTWAAWASNVRTERDETVWEQAWSAIPRTITPRRGSDPGEGPTATLYRFYDAAGVLLYVGQTIRGYERLRQHTRKAWFPEAAQVIFERVPASEILAREAAAIREEHPRYNIAGNPSHRR
jgi:hypothetical protein